DCSSDVCSSDLMSMIEACTLLFFRMGRRRLLCSRPWQPSGLGACLPSAATALRSCHRRQGAGRRQLPGRDREGAGDAPGPVLAALGVRRDPLRRVWRPSRETTVRRVLARLDPDALDLVTIAAIGMLGLGCNFK